MAKDDTTTTSRGCPVCNGTSLMALADAQQCVDCGSIINNDGSVRVRQEPVLSSIEPPTRQEALAGAVLVASQPGSRPDALVGNGAHPQAGARLEDLTDTAPTGDQRPNGDDIVVNNPSLPPLGPGSDQPPITLVHQSPEVVAQTTDAWSLSDGATDAPHDPNENKTVVQVERIGGKGVSTDGIAVPVVYERIVYADGSVANVLKGADDPAGGEKEIAEQTAGTVPAQPNQEAQAEVQAEADVAPSAEPAAESAPSSDEASAEK